MRRMIGLGYRKPLAGWLASRPDCVDCLEITAEHFFDQRPEHLQGLRAHWPLFVHGLGLSLGTPGPLDRGVLANFSRVVRIADPLWISEHVAFTRTEEVDLGHLNPVPLTRQSLQVLADHARELADMCQKPLILENITSFMQVRGELSETEFLNSLCELAGCGLLLDVTNLFVNSRNHRFDPVRWLKAIEPRRIVQLHVVGYSQRNGRWLDDHSRPIQDDLMDLLRCAVEHAPVQAMILERDEEFAIPAIERELRRLEAAVGRS